MVQLTQSIMKPFILIIEDDLEIADNIRYNLEREGSFVAQIALTGEAGLSIALGNGQSRQTGDRARSTPDLIVLDLNLPGISGIDLCRRFRAEEETRRTPIIMLTARTEERDKVHGLDLGADDYITKPFGVREFVARVRAALRRSEYGEISPKFYDDGQLRINYADFSVTCQGRSVNLTRKEFALLATLSRNGGRVASRKQLLDQVWGLDYNGDAHTLNVHIGNLRKKLGVCGDRIETAVGIGYRLCPDLCLNAQQPSLDSYTSPSADWD